MFHTTALFFTHEWWKPKLISSNNTTKVDGPHKHFNFKPMSQQQDHNIVCYFSFSKIGYFFKICKYVMFCLTFPHIIFQVVQLMNNMVQGHIYNGGIKSAFDWYKHPINNLQICQDKFSHANVWSFLFNIIKFS